ncbi:MAG TPA: hypothetical protein VKT27_06125 [Candidatus Binataceae bacterium]|nr:hypothetical protein [Candidatus Binataceae bacterium]
MCAVHRAQYNEYAKKRYQRAKVQVLAQQRLYRTAKKARGICITCTRPVGAGLVQFCDFHNQKLLDHQYEMNGRRAPHMRKHALEARRVAIAVDGLRSSPLLEGRWGEVEPWVMANIELWVERVDFALLRSIDISEVKGI